MDQPILLRHDTGAIATLTLNAPDSFNALSDAMPDATLPACHLADARSKSGAARQKPAVDQPQRLISFALIDLHAEHLR